MQIPTIDNDQISRLRSTARGMKTLESLKNDLTFIDVFNTQVGYELLKDLVNAHDMLLSIISDPDKEATIVQKAEYKIVRAMIKSWASRIERYLEKIGEVKG